MTRWPTLRAALDDLAGKHPVNQSKALMARGVDWTIGEQSAEAEKARALAKIAEIFEANRVHHEAVEARRKDLAA